MSADLKLYGAAVKYAKALEPSHDDIPQPSDGMLSTIPTAAAALEDAAVAYAFDAGKRTRIPLLLGLELVLPEKAGDATMNLVDRIRELLDEEAHVDTIAECIELIVSVHGRLPKLHRPETALDRIFDVMGYSFNRTDLTFEHRVEAIRALLPLVSLAVLINVRQTAEYEADHCDEPNEQCDQEGCGTRCGLDANHDGECDFAASRADSEGRVFDFKICGHESNGSRCKFKDGHAGDHSFEQVPADEVRNFFASLGFDDDKEEG